MLGLMKRHGTAALMLIALFALNSFAQQNNPVAPAPSAPKATAGQVDPIDSQGTRKLSRRERKDRRQKLTDKYQRWLIEVEPIMLPAEMDAFLLLETDAQRDLYIEDFWNRRDPDPKTAANEYREQYGEILEEVRAKYKNTSNDPARVLLLRGRPLEVIKVDCQQYLQPIEIWHYGYIRGFGRDPLLLFYQPRNGVGLRLWIPRGSDMDALSELLSMEGEMAGGVAGVFLESASPYGGNISKIFANCKDGDKVMAAIGWTQSNKLVINELFVAPKVDEEGADDILRSAVISNPSAARLNAELAAAYPGKRGGRTSVEMTVTLPRSELKVKELAGSRFYNLDVVGEILKDGKLFESYRYHFDYPAEATTEKVPVVVERFLRPNTYVVRLKVVDANSGAEAVVEKELAVPEITETAEERKREQESTETLGRIQDEFRSGESRLRIVPLGNDLLTGLQHIETIVSGSDIASVEFYLDNKKVMVKRSPPYTLDLDFGEVPQTHKVKAIALGSKGQIVSGDELVLNTGADPFRVRIVQPRVATRLLGPTRVEIDVDLPEGRSLQKLELWFNETRLATLYDRPFVQTIHVPSNTSIGYLRAVAYLDDDAGAPAEDVVFINTPEYLEQVEVHLIELPVTVISGGRMVTGLKETDFKVMDEGKPATISKFEYVSNLPLSIGMAIDSSASMRTRMLEAQKAGAEFLKNILRKGDRAFVVAFNEEPAVLQKWSDRLSDLNAGIASVRAEESTALYDAVVLSLYHFQGIRGQKALVVISDGKDTSSKFTFDQALEYSRRSGIPIYVVGLGIRAADVETRSKLAKFTGETGGTVYYIEKASDLAKVYDEIQTELRSQYILGIYPPQGVKPGSKWRQVEVDVKNGRARTIRGYYP